MAAKNWVLMPLLHSAALWVLMRMLGWWLEAQLGAVDGRARSGPVAVARPHPGGYQPVRTASQTGSWLLLTLEPRRVWAVHARAC